MVASATLGRVPFIARVRGANVQESGRAMPGCAEAQAHRDEGPEVGEKGWGKQLGGRVAGGEKPREGCLDYYHYSYMYIAILPRYIHTCMCTTQPTQHTAISVRARSALCIQ